MRFDASTPEEEIAAWVTSCEHAEVFRTGLASLLPEQHGLYAGRSTSETTRIRSHILAAFERVGLPSEAIPYVLDELQNSDDAYLVAGAAKALRGAAKPLDVGFATPLLQAARENVRYTDAPIAVEAYRSNVPVERWTTASQEIEKTIVWIGDADCCAVPTPLLPATRKLDLEELELEDQDGKFFRFGDFFSGKPSLVAFFYSRCDNPRKCSLTVTKLAALQRDLVARNLGDRVRLSAITYDPLFDLPERMKAYGRMRGVQFDDNAKFFRVLDIEAVRRAFDLGVNYVGAIVNRHRIELYVLDTKGRVAHSFTRLAWHEREVADCLERLSRRTWIHTAVRAAAAGVTSILLALLPKCPLCLGAYSTALGIGGIELAPHRPWLLPIALLLVLAHVFTVGRRAMRTNRLAPLIASAGGVLALVAGSVAWSVPSLSLSGVVLMVIGASLSAAPPMYVHHLPEPGKRARPTLPQRLLVVGRAALERR